MSQKKIPCDKKGRPITPTDVCWQDALKRALLFLALGVVLLPIGLLLYNLVPLPDKDGALTFLFAILIFFGAIFLLYGIMITVLALLQRRKTLPYDEIKRIALAEGEVCAAAITEIKTKKRRTANGEVTLYRYTLEYFDKPYNYKRRFYTDYITREAQTGDIFTVHYFADSTLNYYIDID